MAQPSILEKAYNDAFGLFEKYIDFEFAKDQLALTREANAFQLAEDQRMGFVSAPAVPGVPADLVAWLVPVLIGGALVFVIVRAMD